MALPQRKSDAMCAMYAFMRRADDISDDESLSLAERRVLMERWWSAFRSNSALEALDESVFLAVRDVQQRFGISDHLLDELVQGTAMDLLPDPPPGVTQQEIAGRSFDVYETLEALERYCYLVASVVGLVTIRIFGYTDSHAEQYAIELGKAFQFTNILRDVKEDAQRGRVYLPVEVLTAHESSPEQVIEAMHPGSAHSSLHAALHDLAGRAEHLYAAQYGLVPLLDADSRAAMRVLISIYHALLREIERSNYQVFARRISVSTPKKVLLLLRGMLSRLVPA